MSTINYTTLAEALCDTPDPCSERGRSYEWEYLLLVIAAAMLTGEKTLKGISQWVIAQGQELKAILKPKKQRVPSLATIRRTLCNVSVDMLEGVLTALHTSLKQARQIRQGAANISWWSNGTSALCTKTLKLLLQPCHQKELVNRSSRTMPPPP